MQIIVTGKRTWYILAGEGFLETLFFYSFKSEKKQKRMQIIVTGKRYILTGEVRPFLKTDAMSGANCTCQIKS